MEFRIECDSLGEIKVPKERLYGAQTARSLENFPISTEKMPYQVIKALILVKKAAAITNGRLGMLAQDKADWIVSACDRLLDHFPAEEFPLSVWQTGSGTQTNMNVNEVLSNLICDMANTPRGSKKPVHPNDDINMSQSSNDVIPTAISIASYRMLEEELIPSLRILHQSLCKKALEFDNVLKIGRTHLMDAVPMTLGQEFSAFAGQIDHAIEAILQGKEHFTELAIGGTAVGTGLNTHPHFSQGVVAEIGRLTSHPFRNARNLFEALATADVYVSMAGALKRVAVAYLKIASDIAMLASGPLCGLAELYLPANEPGSSIMPGKVNPTQCESMQQAACQVIGHLTAIELAATRSNFQLNLYRPAMAYNVVQACRLLSDSANNFASRCVAGIKPNDKKLDYYTHHSLMLVTALNPHIGYDKAAMIAKYAFEKGITLKEAAIALKLLSADEYDAWVKPLEMAKPH